MLIDKKIIDEINEKTDIVSLVSEYVKLEKAGKNFRGLCPFHSETNPSFSVSPEKNIAMCFSCKEGGRPIKFYQKINNIPYMQAVSELGKRLNIDIKYDSNKSPDLEEHYALKEAAQFYHYYLLNSENGLKAQEFLHKRGITKEEITTFNIGLAPSEQNSVYKLLTEKDYTNTELENAGLIHISKDNFIKDVFVNRILFPITDEELRIVGFSGRSLGSEEPKYYNSPESLVFKKSEVLYNFSNALNEIKKHDKVIIHEGFFDVIKSHKAKLKYSVAVMGTALTNEHIKVLSKYTKNVIIAFDGDNAGIEAAIKAIPLFLRNKFRIDVLWIKEGLDPDDYYDKYGKESYLKLYDNLMDHYAFIYEVNKQKLNLKNQNDQEKLKLVVKDLLTYAPSTTKDFYIDKLATDLSVSKESLRGLYYYRQGEAVAPKIRPKKREIKWKYYRAEMFLLIEMFKDKDNAKRIDHALGLKYVVDVDIARLRSIYILKYLKLYKTYDEDKFLELISEKNSELVEPFLRVKDLIAYKNKEPLTDEQINELIKTVRMINEEKAYQDILEQIRKETEAYQKTILLEKQGKLKRTIIK